MYMYTTINVYMYITIVVPLYCTLQGFFLKNQEHNSWDINCTLLTLKAEPFCFCM